VWNGVACILRPDREECQYLDQQTAPRCPMTEGGYRNAAAIITTTPAPPAYMELRDGAAPMKFEGIVEEGDGEELAPRTMLEGATPVE